MTAMKTIEGWMLQAYVDGELEAEERAAVEELLARDPEARASVDAWTRQKQLMKQAYDPVLDEPIPASLENALRKRPIWSRIPPQAVAAGLALFLLGAGGGWLAAGHGAGSPSMRLADEALLAHQVYTVEVKHPVEVPGADRAHLQAWLSKRVGTPFVIPDLTAEGYTLLGGRLLAAEDRPAAQLMYEDAEKRRITIFLAANEDGKDETSMQVKQKGDLITCYWLDGKLAFAMAGEMKLDAMMRLARIVYDQFEA